MRTAKTILLGILFSFAGFVILFVISLKQIMVGSETAHATGLSAVLAVVLETLFSPIMWLMIVIGFGAAMWVERKSNTSTETIKS
jgi:ABC-type Mn2+/Zn2+ transport system permease subunit